MDGLHTTSASDSGSDVSAFNHNQALAHLLAAGVAFINRHTNRIMVRTEDGPQPLLFDDIEAVVDQFADDKG